jgi:hypothetical protein
VGFLSLWQVFLFSSYAVDALNDIEIQNHRAIEEEEEEEEENAFKEQSLMNLILNTHLILGGNAIRTPETT